MNVHGAYGDAARIAPPLPEPPMKPGAANPFTFTSDTDMAIRLYLHFDRFADPAQPAYVTRASLETIAYSANHAEVSPEDRHFARALLENPDLMERLDGYGKHKHDGKIDLNSIHTFVRPQNGPFSAMSDNELAHYLFDRFNPYPNEKKWLVGSVLVRVSRAFLKRVTVSLNATPEARQFAFELLSRPSLMKQMKIRNS